MLMLAVQTMQAILKDVQMREQAHLIQREVATLMTDMGRFRDRVLDLQRHFGQANADIDKILTSADKITKRGQKIEQLDFEDEAKTARDVKTVRDGKAVQNGALSSPAAAPNVSEAGATPAPSKGPRIIRQPDLLAGE
jgi:DNA recombination protein RmuC